MLHYIGFTLIAVEALRTVFGQVGPSDTDVLIADTVKKCSGATSKEDCYARGCYHECAQNACLPVWAACSTGASNLCYPHCQDQSACEAVATNECVYNADDTCSSTIPESRSALSITNRHPIRPECPYKNDYYLHNFYCNSFLPYRDPYHHPVRSANGTCTAMCTIDACCDFECDINPPTVADLCRQYQHQNHECCKTIITTTTTSSSTTTTTSTTTTSTTTETPTTSTTTEDPTTTTTMGPAGPTPDPVIDKKCEMLTPDPMACRNDPDCFYNCGIKKCVNKDRVQPQCLQSCLQFCDDPCGCKHKDLGGVCEYNLNTGQCLPRESECSHKLFQPWECVNAGDYRAGQGMICYNAADFGNCAIKKNVLSVNLNGLAHTDIRSVAYEAGALVPFEDTYNTALPYYAHDDVLHPDFELWKGIVGGNPKGSDLRQCLRYTIPIYDDGVYQITIKTQEISKKSIGGRLFNVEVADQVVISNLDMLAIAGKISYPLTFTISFKVAAASAPGMKLLELPYHPQLTVNNEVKLGFCVGECRFDKRFKKNVGQYIVAAISVVMVN